MGKDKKVYVGFMLEEEYKMLIEKVVEEPTSTFDSEAGLIRYCIKKTFSSDPSLSEMKKKVQGKD